MVSGNNKILLKNYCVCSNFFFIFLAVFAIYTYICSVIKNK